MKKFYLFLLLNCFVHLTFGQLKLSFPSKDGITITADWYPVSSELPTILLCHQNGYSRGEYSETALRLNKFGFNCLAIDQRVGNEVNGIKNETARAAMKRGLNPSYLDAEQDMIAALDYLYERYKRPITILGSSYSASLALKIANNNPKVASVILFSPGEYFDDKQLVNKSIQSFSKPIFVSSSLEESDAVTDLLKDVNSRIKIQYIPASRGDHGSKVLWAESLYNQEYWIALMSYLNKLKNIQ